MNKNFSFVRLFSWVLTVSLLLSGCGLVQVKEGGTLRQETHSVDLDHAASVKVQIDMGLGELKIGGGSARLMEGTFEYNVTDWKPEVVYEIAEQAGGRQGTLVIDQPDNKGANLVSNAKNTWDLRLGGSVPMDLDIKVGAGESQIDLTGIDLTRLNIDTGLGTLDLDLRGNWTHDLDIVIKGGVGEVTLHLPDEIGARVEVQNGLGSVKETGMDKDGNVYVNGSYGKSPYTLNIRIDNGTGNVKLEA